MADQYAIKDKTVICQSESGSTYIITRAGCSCTGYAYRRICRHYKEAEYRGLIEQAERPRTLLLRSPMIIASRKKAIVDYLTKNKIPFTNKKVDKLESVLNINMTPEEFSQLAKST